MLKRIVMIFLTLLCVVTVYGQPATFHQRGDEDAVLPTYISLAPLDIKEQIAIARELPAQTLSALWVVHLNNFLRANPALTDDQKVVVYQAIGFVASGNLEIPHDSIGWQTKGLPMLLRLKQAVELEFPPDLAREAFMHMEATIPVVPRVGEPIHHERALGMSRPDCDCHEGNYVWTSCGSTTSPSKCHSNDGQYRCTPHVDGCGMFWQEACDGLCV